MNLTILLGGLALALGAGQAVLWTRHARERRRAAELAGRVLGLEQERALQQAVNEQAPEMLVLVDAGSGRVSDCNARALELVGRSRGEVLDRPLLQFMPERQPDGRSSAELLRVIDAAIRREPQTEMRWTWLRPDGSTATSIGSVSLVTAGDRACVQLRGRADEGSGRGLMRSLGDIAMALSTATGEDFFVELARGISRIFVVEHVLVGRFAGDRHGELVALAHVAPGTLYRDVVWPIGASPEDSPFQHMRQGRVKVYGGDLQERYPGIGWFRDNGITSLLGVPALDAHGGAVGVIALFGSRPLPDPMQVEYAAQIFAARVAAEIERLNVLQALRRGEADLRLALAASDTALWVWYPDSGELRLTRVVAERGAALHETTGTLERWMGGREPAQAALIEAQLRETEGAGRVVRFEFSNVTGDRTSWFEAVGRPQRDGERRCVRGTVRDITERQHLIEALATSEARLLGAMADSDTGVWEWDPATDRLQVIASDANAFFRVARGIPTMREFLGWRTPEHRAQFEEQLQRVVHGDGRFEVEFSAVPAQGGELRWFRSIARMDRGGPDAAPIVRGLVQDTTAEHARRVQSIAAAERLRLAMHAASAMVFEWSPVDDTLVLVGERTPQGGGHGPVSMEAWLAPLPEATRVQLRGLLARVVAGGQTEALDFLGIDARGEPGWREVTVCPQSGSDGGITHVIGVVRDIDERHRVQEAFAMLARASTGQGLEAFLRSTVESLVALFDVDVVALERYHPGPEPRMQVIAEWDSGGFVTPYEYPLAGTPEEVVIARREVIECEDVATAFPADPWYSGRPRMGTLSAPLLDSAGEAIGVISLMHSRAARLPEWTRRLVQVFAERIALELDRGAALAALEAHRAGLEALVAQRTRRVQDQAQILDKIREAVIVRDVAGIILWANAGAVQMFGYPREALAGMPVTRLLMPEDVPEFTGLDLETVYRSNDRTEQELSVRHADGHAIETLMSGTATRNEDGSLRQIIYLVMDISERRAAERELLRNRAELAELAAELEAFSYSVSHDLRAPLRTIDGFSLALEEDCGERLDAAGMAHLRRIRAAAHRMGQLIDDLLEFARIARREPDRGTVDLAQVAQEAVDRLREAEPGRRVELRIGAGLQCQGDRGLLSIVMDNLVGNAWKYTGRVAQAHIEIDSEERDGERLFYVRDNGAGFDMRYADRLFGVFQRLHQSQEFEGTGVGLATVKRILQRHGGRIWAESAPDCGACFRFTVEPAPTSSRARQASLT